MEHLLNKFTPSLPERIILRKDNSEGTVTTGGKKIRIILKPWTGTVHGNELKFEPFDRQLGHSRKTLFEVDWKTAQQDPLNWLVWQSPEYGSRSFNEKLECMTETERVLALKEKYGEKFVDKPVGKILSNLEKLDKANEMTSEAALEAFEYVFPDHLLQKIGAKHTLYKWFLANCTGVQPKLRRKALVLFSEQRGLGKTEFAYDLVGRNTQLVLKIRGVAAAKENFANQSTAKLLLLDDFAWDADKQRDITEEIKALVVGQSTNIRGCAFVLVFAHGLPTIITVNSKKQYSMMLSHPMFQTSCKFVEVKSFLGPPGTEPTDLSQDMRNEVETCVIDFDDHNHHQQRHHHQVNENSNDSERFKETIKLEEWSSSYKGCSEEERQSILTKLTEISTELERLRSLHAIQQQRAPTINVTNNNFNYFPPNPFNTNNAAPILGGNQNRNEISYVKKPNHEEAEEQKFESERERSPYLKKKLLKSSDEVPSKNLVGASLSSPSLSLSSIMTRWNSIPGVNFDGYQLPKVIKATEFVSSVKLHRLLAWSKRRIETEQQPQPQQQEMGMEMQIGMRMNKSEYGFKRANESGNRQQQEVEDHQQHHNDSGSRDRQSYSLFHAYMLCCKKSELRIEPSEELLAVGTCYFPASRMNKKINHNQSQQQQMMMLGRIYGGASTSNRPPFTGTMQTFEKSRRAYLCEGIYWDLDQINSHPSLLISLLEHLNISVPQLLKEYVEDRQKVLAQISASYSIDHAIAKNLMLRILYGGSLKNWVIDHKLGYPTDELLDQNLEWFAEDLLKINDKLQRLPLFASALKVYDRTYEEAEKTRTSFLSLICGEYERHVLIFVKQWLSQQIPPRHLDVLIHDGGLLRRLLGETEPPQKLLHDLNNELRLLFKTPHIKFDYKKFNNVLAAEIDSRDGKGGRKEENEGEELGLFE